MLWDVVCRLNRFISLRMAAVAVLFALATSDVQAGLMLPWVQESGSRIGNIALDDEGTIGRCGSSCSTKQPTSSTTTGGEQPRNPVPAPTQSHAFAGLGLMTDGAGAPAPVPTGPSIPSLGAMLELPGTSALVASIFARWREVAPRLPLPPTDDLSRPPKTV